MVWTILRINTTEAADLRAGLGVVWNIRKAREKSKFLTVALKRINNDSQKCLIKISLKEASK